MKSNNHVHVRQPNRRALRRQRAAERAAEAAKRSPEDRAEYSAACARAAR